MASLACRRLGGSGVNAMRQQQEHDGVNGLSSSSFDMRLHDWSVISLARNRHRTGGDFVMGWGARPSLSVLCAAEGAPARDQPPRFDRSATLDNASSTCLTSSDSDVEEEDGFSSSSGSSSSSFVFSSTFSDATTASPPGEPEEHVNGPLDSLRSLGDALPLKRRGLSQYFSGKSQSFSSLADVASVDDLSKPENPFVKRPRTASFAATSAPPGVQVSGRGASFPPLPSTSSLKGPLKRTHTKKSQRHVAGPLVSMSSKSFSSPNLSFCD